jgi:hypothetical protein
MLLGLVGTITFTIVAGVPRELMAVPEERIDKFVMSGVGLKFCGWMHLEHVFLLNISVLILLSSVLLGDSEMLLDKVNSLVGGGEGSK